MESGTEVRIYIKGSILYKYDIPVGFPPGIFPRERIVARGRSPRAAILCFIISNKIQNTKGGKITNTREFD